MRIIQLVGRSRAVAKRERRTSRSEPITAWASPPLRSPLQPGRAGRGTCRKGLVPWLRWYFLHVGDTSTYTQI